ncbi:MAG: MFS transporter [Planctomycetales bacterium]|jgi:FSR family fosmidomycin resistance protein-like MFS transporter
MQPHTSVESTLPAWTALICLALLHTLVDTCALLIAPLWPRLETFYGFGVAGLSIAFIAQSMPTSISQVVFGWLRDRRPAPIWLWLGPVIAALFLTSIGRVDQRMALFGILLFGGIGVGAFHPEAAVLAGRILPGQRTRGISLFMFGGSLGLGLGPILSGMIVTERGLPGLTMLTIPVAVLAIVLFKVGRLGSAAARLLESPADKPSTTVPTLSETLDGRGSFAIVLLIVCSLRLVPNMAMDKILAFTLSQPQWGYTEAEIGLAQSVFLIAASVGMFFMVFRFRSGWEKPFMIGCPLIGIPLMLVLAWENCPPWLMFSTLALAGIVLWGTSPAMVSYAQQQFPKGTGLASALTMGMSWGIGGLIQAPVTSYFEKAGTPQMAFAACIPCLLASGLIAIGIPGCSPPKTDEKPESA